MRATSLIAGPITVKSSRSIAPTLPYSAFAKMEREIDRGEGRACGRARRIERIDVAHRLDRGVERAAASLRPIRLFEREDGEHAVADELEHLAAARAERGGQDLEHVIEQFDDDGTRRRVADRL